MAALAADSARAAELFLLGAVPQSWGEDCSSDGTVVVGRDLSGPWYWTRESWVVPLNSVAIPAGGQARVTADGHTLLCQAFDPGTARTEVMLLDIPTLSVSPVGSCGVNCDIRPSTAWDMTRDASTVVGLGSGNGGSYAFGWSAPAASPRNLGTLYFYKPSRANAVNDDASVIVGWNDDYSGFRQGAVWRRNAKGAYTQQNLTTIVSGATVKLREAMAVSGDGAWVYGIGRDVVDSGAPWRWSVATGYQPILPNPMGSAIGAVTAANHDGSMLIAFFGAGAALGEGYVWLANRGWLTLESFATERGVVMPAGVHLALPLNMSEDGLTIVGTARGDFGMSPFVLDLRIGANCAADINHDGLVSAPDMAATSRLSSLAQAAARSRGGWSKASDESSKVPQCTPTPRCAPRSRNSCTPSSGLTCMGAMMSRGR
jgi:hypothetical protein